MAKIKMIDLGKTYPGGVEVIKDLNLEIEDKEFVVLVGPSGCGKSTTLRMIAGLEDITAGQMYIGDLLVNGIAPKDRNIAMVFQNYALYPHMTVYKNMAFALKLRKTPPEEIEAKVKWAAEILGIEDLMQRKPKALSGGQRQRVALGRAMVRNPAVFLLDEPLSNLDAKLRNQMRSEICKLHKKLKTTFVYVTHDQTEAMTMGDRICVMNEGKIMQFDRPQELYDRPANLFVAGFIGSPQMNFIQANLRKKDQDYYLKVKDYEICLPQEKYEGLNLDSYLNQDLVMGLRPEAFMLSPTPDSQKIKVKVDLIELLGAEIHLQVSIQADNLIARVPSHLSCQEDDELDLFFEASSIHLFDPQTKKTIFN